MTPLEAIRWVARANVVLWRRHTALMAATWVACVVIVTVIAVTSTSIPLTITCVAVLGSAAALQAYAVERNSGTTDELYREIDG